MSAEELAAKCGHLEATIARLELHMLSVVAKADHAAEVALGAIETIRHTQSALEHGHAQTGEMLSAMRRLIGMTEASTARALAVASRSDK